MTEKEIRVGSKSVGIDATLYVEFIFEGRKTLLILKARLPNRVEVSNVSGAGSDIGLLATRA